MHELRIPPGARVRVDTFLQLQALASCLTVAALATASPPLPIKVELTGFVPESTSRSPDGTLPIRWDMSRRDWLDDAADCELRWRTRPIHGDPDWPGLLMHSENGPEDSMLVRTCEEWVVARAKGHYTATSVDMAAEVEFIFANGMLEARSCVQPAARTGFAQFDLLEAAGFLLPPADDTDASRDTTEEEAPRWRIAGNTMHWEGADCFVWIKPVLFGDLDGDGWEDMLALSGSGATHGTVRSGSVRAFTRIDDGPLVDITARIALSTERGLPTRRPRSLSHTASAIAPRHEFTLEGLCHCGGSAHRLDGTLVIDAGIAEGKIHCAELPKPIPVRGALGPSTGFLQTDSRWDNSALGWWFDWTLTDGQLTMHGFRGPEVGFEGSDFAARASVLTPDERMRAEGWRSELRFRIADSELILRRGCGFHVNHGPTDTLCLDLNGVVVELARLDRIEWGSAQREPEDEPATDEEMRRHVRRSVHRVGNGDQMLLLDGWSYGASTNNPMVIAIPIRGGALAPAETEIFPLATVEFADGIAYLRTHDLRAGADPYAGHPARPSVAWHWKGGAWSDE